MDLGRRVRGGTSSETVRESDPELAVCHECVPIRHPGSLSDR